jgi:hypothetical protein
MSDFNLYLHLGLTHILDLNGYDHILFVATLCLIYQWRQYKEVGILVTAFTIGHSVTLALAVLDLIQFNPHVIEILIPITIIIASFENLVSLKYTQFKQAAVLRYITAGTFGLIHGMGFSNYLRLLIIDSDTILLPLFSFNLGLEVGQLMIVTMVLLINSLVAKLLPNYYLKYVGIGSVAIALTALILLLG